METLTHRSEMRKREHQMEGKKKSESQEEDREKEF